ncbi:MAG: type 4a pilus biogenesis protein PilO [Nitrospirae bacterium]|nr:type 4a pilus biogenesis protein PilO [Nitrospirota bacterium]
MMLLINKIKNLPPNLQIGIAVLPSVILIALFFFLIYSPKNQEVGTLNAKIAQMDKDIAIGQEKVKRLDALIAENALLKEQLIKLKEQLPPENEVSELLKQISELGIGSGLQILLWKPEAKMTQTSGLYIEIPVKVEVLAAYHKLGDFFSHISRLPRLVNISDITLKVMTKEGREDLGTINASFTARTFASVTQEGTSEPKGNKANEVQAAQ